MAARPGWATTGLAGDPGRLFQGREPGSGLGVVRHHLGARQLLLSGNIDMAVTAAPAALAVMSRGSRHFAIIGVPENFSRVEA